MIDVTKLAQGVDWKIAYAEVEKHAREILTRYSYQRPDGVGTTELAEALLPAEFVRGDGTLYIRRRIFKALAALATRGLADCATPGETIKGKFGPKRPWRWHAPTPGYVHAPAVCKTCGRPL